MRMSYRRAWLLVQAMNEAAGEPLVRATTGGAHGGGAQLTHLGQQAVAFYRQVQAQLWQAAQAPLPPRCLFEKRELGAEAALVHVAAAVSLEEVLGLLLADYASAHPEVRVRAVFGASDELADHVLAGAPADLFLTADERPLDRLVEARLLAPGARRPLIANSLAAIGAPGGPLRVRRPTDLVRPAVGRIALAGPSCPLGGYTRTYLESLGLYEALLPRAVSVDSSRAVVSAVRAGRADVGLIYGSDAAPDCPLLFRVRPASAPILYSAAVLERGHAEQAQHLLDFLISPGACARFRHARFRLLAPRG
jgi:molybdate transport system substrate-binding protein